MQITWDRFAVPTITGDDDLDVVRGVGYAQAVAVANDVLELYGLARGKAASYWGPDFFGEDTFTDGLLTQGAEGYQLTWMDAKVGDWVVTPRRGKPVAKLVPAGPGFDRVKAREAIAGLLEASRGITLGGLKIKDLISEGRS